MNEHHVVTLLVYMAVSAMIAALLAPLYLAKRRAHRRQQEEIAATIVGVLTLAPKPMLVSEIHNAVRERGVIQDGEAGRFHAALAMLTANQAVIITSEYESPITGGRRRLYALSESGHERHAGGATA